MAVHIPECYLLNEAINGRSIYRFLDFMACIGSKIVRSVHRKLHIAFEPITYSLL